MRPKVYFSDRIKLIGTEQGIPYHDALILVLSEYFEERARQVCKKAKAAFDTVYEKDSGKIERNAIAISSKFDDLEGLSALGKLNSIIEKMVKRDIENYGSPVETNPEVPEAEQVLKCPQCGRRLRYTPGVWHSGAWKCKCGFIVYDCIAGAEITEDEVAKILTGNGSIMTFWGRKGEFHARLKVSPDKTKLVFDLPEPEDTGLRCPKCGKRILDHETYFCCEAKDFFCWRERSGVVISREELKKILAGNGSIMTFHGKSLFDARLKISPDKTKLVFDFPEPEDTGLRCPHCGKRILEDGRSFRCEDGDFKCWKEIRNARISRKELGKVLDGQNPELTCLSFRGFPYEACLKLNEAKDGLDVEKKEKKNG